MAVVSIAALLVLGYVGVGAMADELAQSLPDAAEVEYFGNLGANEPGWSTKLDTPQRKKAGRVFDLLKRARGLRALDYKLYFMPEKLPNAFSLPGGSIAITEGLLAMVDGEIGLAEVIGHELGHQQFRHSLKMMGRKALFVGVGTVMLGGGSMLFGSMVDIAQSSHSRQQEFDADAYGLALVHHVIGTTKGALEFFEKIEKDPRMAGSKFDAMLSTHPYTPERIKRLRELDRKLAREGRAAPPPAPAAARDDAE